MLSSKKVYTRTPFLLLTHSATIIRFEMHADKDSNL